MLSKALIECADLRQDHIDVLTDSQLIWTGKTNSQVEREITTFCNELKSSYDKYLKDGA